MAELVGQIVAGRYRVLRRLGQGGMAEVFEVESTSLRRRFALKTLAPDLAASPEFVARFRREAEIVARLHHPGIVSIVDWDALPDGQPFFVMELLAGVDLESRLRAAPSGLPWPEVKAIAAQTLEAIGEAHRHGVVHRDLKPANIFLTSLASGEVHVKLLDFGLARTASAQRITRMDVPQRIGSLGYMAPEQEAGELDLGPAVDVWAMGTILYEIVAGRRPFEPDAPRGRPVPLRVLREEAPAALADAIEAALSRRPERRIVSIEELARRVLPALAQALTPREPASPPRPGEPRPDAPSPPPRELAAPSPSAEATPRPRRWPRRIVVAAAVTAATLIVAALVVERADDRPSRATPAPTDAGAVAATPSPADAGRAAAAFELPGRAAPDAGATAALLDPFAASATAGPELDLRGFSPPRGFTVVESHEAAVRLAGPQGAEFGVLQRNYITWDRPPPGAPDCPVWVPMWPQVDGSWHLERTAWFAKEPRWEVSCAFVKGDETATFVDRGSEVAYLEVYCARRAGCGELIASLRPRVKRPRPVKSTPPRPREAPARPIPADDY